MVALTGRAVTVCAEAKDPRTTDRAKEMMTQNTRLSDASARCVAPAGAGTSLATPQPSSARAVSADVYAALDLGTNNCRLLIARPTVDGFRVIDSFSRIIRLGEGVSINGRIGSAAVNRAVGALAVCREKIALRRATRTRLIATEACRAAANAEEVLREFFVRAGLQLEIIDRETEATLAMTGSAALLDADGRGAILFDIGGGSSEIVKVTRNPDQPLAPPHIKAWTSIPLGVVTLAERFGGRDVTEQSYAEMVEAVSQFVRPFAAEHAADLESMHLLGTSGTVTTLAGVFLNLARYDRRRVDGIWLDQDDITRAIRKLMSMDYNARAANQCIGEQRADLVLAGCAILDAIRAAFPLPRLRVADRGLREGMLIEMMRQDRACAA